MYLCTLINFYLIVILQYSLCCICTHHNNTIYPSRLKGETGDIKEKRQLRLNDYGSLEFVIDSDATDMDSKRSSSQTIIMTNVTSTELDNIDKEANITSIELREMTIPGKSMNSIIQMTTPVNNITILNINDMMFNYLNNVSGGTSEPYMNTIASEQTTIKQDSRDEEQVGDCNKYRTTKQFDLNKLADVWKITFYTIPTTLKCFRLYIKTMTLEDRKRYENMYGDFNDKINWNNCILEITSSDHKRRGVQRRHFLQKNNLYHGVMDNIIIDQESNGNTTAVLHEESADQWLVIKNLLLMRDCSTGDLVVFSRVPSEPLMMDIEDALVEFGETGPINGTRACEGFIKAWVKVG